MPNVIGIDNTGNPIYESQQPPQTQKVTGIDANGMPVYGNSLTSTAPVAPWLSNSQAPAAPQVAPSPMAPLKSQAIADSNSVDTATAQALAKQHANIGTDTFNNMKASLGANYADTPDLAVTWLNKNYGTDGTIFRNDPNAGIVYSKTPKDPDSWNKFQTTFPTSLSAIPSNVAQKLPDITEAGTTAAGALIGATGGPLGVAAGGAGGATLANALKQAIGNYVQKNPDSTYGIDIPELVGHGIAGGVGPYVGEKFIGPAIAKAGGSLSEALGKALTNESNPFEVVANDVTKQEQPWSPIAKINQLGGSSWLDKAVRNTNNKFVQQSLGTGSASLQSALSLEGPNALPFDATSSDLNQALQKALVQNGAKAMETAESLYGPVKGSMSDIPFSLAQKNNLLEDLGNNGTDFMNPSATQKLIALTTKLDKTPITSSEDLLNFMQSKAFKSATTDSDSGTARELATLKDIFQKHLSDSVEENPDVILELGNANNYWSTYKNNLEPILDAIKADKSDSGFSAVNTMRNNLPSLGDLMDSVNGHLDNEGLNESRPLFERGMAKNISNEVMDNRNNVDWAKLGDIVNSGPKYGYLQKAVQVPNHLAEDETNEVASNMMDKIADIAKNPELMPETEAKGETQTLEKGLFDLLKLGTRNALNIGRVPLTAPLYRPYTTLGNAGTSSLADMLAKSLAPSPNQGK